MTDSALKSESKYERLRKIGIGSYGVVFKCVNRQSGQIVAIKRYSENDSDPIIRKIAMREVRMLRQLNHPNLINLIEVFRRKRRLHLVFDYCELTVLDVIEKYGNSCPVNLIRKIVWQIVNGINYCHTHNCIHRDIKPENILINGQGVVKLCDFGFARNFEQGQLLTSSGKNAATNLRSYQAGENHPQDDAGNSKENNPTSVAADRQALTEYVATRWYRAPELLIGEMYYDIKIDIWALGCVTAELMRGEPVWPGKTDLDQLFMIKSSMGQLTSSQTHTLLTQNIYDQTNIERLLNQTSNPNDAVERKLPLSRIGQSGVNFVISCLQMDPKRRPTSDELLNHGYIQSARMVQFMKDANSIQSQAYNHRQIISSSDVPNSYKGSLLFPAGQASLHGTHEQFMANSGTPGARSNSQSLLIIANANGAQKVNQQQHLHYPPVQVNTSKTFFSPDASGKQLAASKETKLPSPSLLHQRAGTQLHDKVNRLPVESKGGNINNKPTKRPKQPIYSTGGIVINSHQGKTKELKKNQSTNRRGQQQQTLATDTALTSQLQQLVPAKSGASKLPITIKPSGISTTTNQVEQINIRNHCKRSLYAKLDEQSPLANRTSSKLTISTRKHSKSNSNLPLTSCSQPNVLAEQNDTDNTSNKNSIIGKPTTYQTPKKTTHADARSSIFLVNNTLDSSASSSSLSGSTLNTMRSSSISFLPKIVQQTKQQSKARY